MTSNAFEKFKELLPSDCSVDFKPVFAGLSQKRQTGLFRNVRTSQRQTGSYRTENQLGIHQVDTLDCYSTCQCSALLNGVFVSRNGFPVRVVSFFRINIPLFEPYHGKTAERSDTPCWLWTCRNSRLKLFFVKSESGEGVGMMYWQKTM